MHIIDMHCDTVLRCYLNKYSLAENPGHIDLAKLKQGGCLARSAVLASDLDESIPGLAINRFCASGMEAVNLAANQVKGGAFSDQEGMSM